MSFKNSVEQDLVESSFGCQEKSEYLSKDKHMVNVDLVSNVLTCFK